VPAVAPLFLLVEERSPPATPETKLFPTLSFPP